MHPQPPRRADSAKYQANTLSETFEHAQGSTEYRPDSLYQLNFLVEDAHTTTNPALTATVPPLSAFSPDSSPLKGIIATGYTAKTFQSHSRHPNGNTSMVSLTSYSNTPPLTPRKSSLSNLANTKAFGNLKIETDLSLPKKEEGYISLERKTENSVDDFMAKLMGLDSESNAYNREYDGRKFARNQAFSYLDDTDMESINESLRVTSLLDSDYVPTRNLSLPKSFELDPELKDTKQTNLASSSQFIAQRKTSKGWPAEIKDLLEVNWLEKRDEELSLMTFVPPKTSDLDFSPESISAAWSQSTSDFAPNSENDSGVNPVRYIPKRGSSMLYANLMGFKTVSIEGSDSCVLNTDSPKSSVSASSKQLPPTPQTLASEDDLKDNNSSTDIDNGIQGVDRAFPRTSSILYAKPEDKITVSAKKSDLCVQDTTSRNSAIPASTKQLPSPPTRNNSVSESTNSTMSSYNSIQEMDNFTIVDRSMEVKAATTTSIDPSVYAQSQLPPPPLPTRNNSVSESTNSTMSSYNSIQKMDNFTIVPPVYAQSQPPPLPARTNSVSERTNSSIYRYNSSRRMDSSTLVDSPMEVTTASMDSMQSTSYVNGPSQLTPPPPSSASESPLMATNSSMVSYNSIQSPDNPKILDVPNAVENFGTVTSLDSVHSMSHFDRKSNSTESISSNSNLSASGAENPTFQTLRRSKDTRPSKEIEAPLADANFEAMKAAAKKSNNPQVQFDFATFCIQRGDPFADVGISYLQKLAKSGFSDAQFILGQAYADDKRYDVALRFFSAATKRNHYESAYQAGCLCEHGGYGLKRNEKEALNYYTKAGSSGHKKAMYRLALAELYGQLGLRRNINNGMKWLKRGEAVADDECPEPLYELSLVYEVGIYPVVTSDHDHAFSLLKEAADFNYPPALYKLGYCYEYGHLGVEIDISTSISLYQIAAKAGNKEAQLALSGWLLSGYSPIIAKNERESFYWAHLSALQGLARAEYTMGYFLESGIGANRNNTEAIKWYQSAARHGDEMALKRLSEIGYSPKSSKKNKLLSFF